MSNQLQIESYRISMRKLRTFYGKVTEFLNDDKIAYLHRLGMIVIINVYWCTISTGYLYRLCVCLCILVACLCCLIHNGSCCLWNKLRDSFEDWLYDTPSKPGEYIDNLHVIIHDYNEESPYGSENPLLDYIHNQGKVVMEKHMKYFET